MLEIMAHGKTLPQAYHDALKALEEFGEVSACPDYNTTQKEVSMTICVEDALAEPMISKLFIGGHTDLEQYRQEILDGILDFRIGKGWDYTYHSRIQGQIPWLLDELKRNPDTRRAVIDVRDFEHDTNPGNSSPACLQHLQFFIRGGKLHLKVLMRSNDAAEATFMNAFAFIMLQEKIAKILGIDVGSYTHRANSFHCYEKDFKLLARYVKSIMGGEVITFEYKGFFEDLMEEAQPEIAEKVRKLKENT